MIISNDSLNTLVSHLPGMIYRCKNDEHYTMDYVSDGCFALTGFRPEQLIDNKLVSYAQLIMSDDIEKVDSIVNEVLANKSAFGLEYRIITRQGETKWVFEQCTGVWDAEGELEYFEGFITDIDDLKREQDRLQQAPNLEAELPNLALLNEYKKLVDENSIVTKTDQHGVINYVNDEFCRVSGYSRQEVLGKTHSVVRHPDNSDLFFQSIWQTISSKQTWTGIIKNKRKDASTYYVKSIIAPILNQQGEIESYIAIRNDVTELITQEKLIKYQTTDKLTLLPNRQKLLEDLASANHSNLAILNLVAFRQINEYYGFDIGDQLIQELATTLSELSLGSGLMLYKLSGDRHAILAEDKQSTKVFAEKITNLTRDINQRRFYIKDHSIDTQMIAGVSTGPNHLIRAEMAVNYAKDLGSELVVFEHHANIKTRLINNVYWTRQISLALQEDRVVIFTQPIVCNKTAKIERYECLVRIIDRTGAVEKSILPEHFLHIAKKSRLYHALTQRIIKKSFEYFKDKKESFSINITLDDIHNPDTVQLLVDKISENPGIGKRLILEIVECAELQAHETSLVFIRKMKALGCEIAIDDFGNGYFNFDHLMRLDADYIKIDAEIIKNIEQDPKARIVTELIHDFAKRLGIKTIAEFVDSKNTHEFLMSLGVDYSQGFYLGRPTAINTAVSVAVR